VILHPDEAVYEVILEEDDTRIEVLVLVCDDGTTGGEPIDCPVHVYLDAPRRGREVVDRARDGATIEDFVPSWGERTPQSAPVRIRT
jgi:hypothetical protein